MTGLQSARQITVPDSLHVDCSAIWWDPVHSASAEVGSCEARGSGARGARPRAGEVEIRLVREGQRLGALCPWQVLGIVWCLRGYANATIHVSGYPTKDLPCAVNSIVAAQRAKSSPRCLNWVQA